MFVYIVYMYVVLQIGLQVGSKKKIFLSINYYSSCKQLVPNVVGLEKGIYACIIYIYIIMYKHPHRRDLFMYI